MLTSKNIGIKREYLREGIIKEGDSVNIYHVKRRKGRRKGKEKRWLLYGA